jgi:formylglycine-generating enzyme required for sulfatase activity
VTVSAPDWTFALIQPGTFQMGSTTGNTDERPVRSVTLTGAFRMQTTEVTQAQWTAVMGDHPSLNPSCGSACPVENVSWNDIQLFLTRLNEQDPGKGYRLPTEAEWEYAARAGTTGDYGVMDGTRAVDLRFFSWYAATSGGRKSQVRLLAPNAWGLYDMHGNVAEWVQDWYDSGYHGRGVNVDPPGPTSGTRRVIRGGDWSGQAGNVRSASRSSGVNPDAKGSTVGLRLVRNP